MKSKPRFKPDTRAQYQMAYVSLLDQLTPGTLEHAIDYLVDSKIEPASINWTVCRL